MYDCIRMYIIWHPSMDGFAYMLYCFQARIWWFKFKENLQHGRFVLMDGA